MATSHDGASTPSSYGARKRSPLTPFIIVALLALAVLAWLACLDAARLFMMEQEAPAALSKPAVLASELKPEPHTQEFMPAAVPLSGEHPPFYLYVSPTTESYLAGVGGDYALLVTPWKKLLKSGGHRHQVTNRLSAVPKNNRSVLILPSSIALSEAERQELRSFQQAGGNLLATWFTGSVDGAGEWKGDGFLHDMFGIRIAGELENRDDLRFLNLFGETPLTVGYPAGMRIWLNNVAEPALKLAGNQASAIYTDWIRSTSGKAGSAAILYAEHGAQRQYARWVAIGFAETTWEGQEKKLSGLMENALHWLARGTAVTKTAWPAPYRAAYLIEMDTEDGFANARHFAALMDEAQLPATFYSLTSEAIRYPYLVRHLSKRHEIAYHGDIHVGFRGQPEQLQRERLKRMQREIGTILGDGPIPTGFRAPEEKYDRVTEKLLHELGFRHHAADPARTDARLPFFVSDHGSGPQQALVVLPRTQHDDIGLRIRERPQDLFNEVRQELINDFDDALRMGALGLLSVHSQYFGKNSILYTIFPSFLEHVIRHREQVWVATGHDISEWWRDRERLSYQASGPPENLLLTVNVAGREPLKRGSLIINNRGANVPAVLTGFKGLAPPARVHKLDAYRSLLVFDELPPGSHTYTLKVAADLEP